MRKIYTKMTNNNYKGYGHQQWVPTAIHRLTLLIESTAEQSIMNCTAAAATNT